MRSFIAASVIALVAAFMPVATAGAAEAPPLTDRQARSYYTKNVCPVVRASDRFYERIWRGRDTISEAEVRRRLPELRRLSSAHAPARYNWARKLLNPPAPWPTKVAGLVRSMANTNVRHSNLLYRQGSADSARQWLALNGRVNDLPYGNQPAAIRARLDLPRTTNCG